MFFLQTARLFTFLGLNSSLTQSAGKLLPWVKKHPSLPLEGGKFFQIFGF